MDKKPTRSDWYIIAIFFSISIFVTLLESNLKEELWESVYDTVIYMTSAILTAFVVVYILFPKYFPQRRIYILLFWTVMTLMVFGVIEYFAYDIIDGLDFRVIGNFKLYIWGIISSSQNAGILIGILLGKKFYDVQLDMQKKEKEIRASELRRLKAQVDPHFLFNNLNTVDALIDRDPAAAKVYINKLSQLYRYLIATKDDEVVPLSDEISFAQNYIHLIEKRFGGSYVFTIKGQDDVQESMIPPGALQTVIENVVKHNSGSVTDPVKTLIEITEGQVIVSNNKNAMKKAVVSTHSGISNLKARYHFLTEKQVEIVDNTNYKIHLPTLSIVD